MWHQNEKFLNLLDKVGEILVSSNATNTEEALALDVDGKDLNTIILEASGVIGEKDNPSPCWCYRKE